MTHSGFAYRYELDEPLYFELCRLSFKGDDYKYPVVIKIAVLMCDNLNVGIEAFVAWLREENVQPPPQILMLLRRRRAARGKGRHTGARRGIRAGKALRRGAARAGLGTLAEDGDDDDDESVGDFKSRIGGQSMQRSESASSFGSEASGYSAMTSMTNFKSLMGSSVLGGSAICGA